MFDFFFKLKTFRQFGSLENGKYFEKKSKKMLDFFFYFGTPQVSVPASPFFKKFETYESKNEAFWKKISNYFIEFCCFLIFLFL